MEIAKLILAVWGAGLATILAVLRCRDRRLKRRARLRVEKRRLKGDMLAFVVRNEGETPARSVQFFLHDRNGDWQRVASRDASIDCLEPGHATTIRHERASDISSEVRVEWKNADGSVGSLTTSVGRFE